MKGLLAHKLRLALTGLAIVLGVTFVSGTLVLTDTLHSTFTSLFENIYQHVDFEVRGTAALGSNSSGGATRNAIPESVATTVGRVPGVAVAEGTVSGYAQFVAPDGQAVTTGGAPTIGTSFVPNSELSPLRVVQGSPPTTANEVAMDEATAQKYHFRVGEHVRVLLDRSDADLHDQRRRQLRHGRQSGRRHPGRLRPRHRSNRARRARQVRRRRHPGCSWRQQDRPPALHRRRPAAGHRGGGWSDGGQRIGQPDRPGTWVLLDGSLGLRLHRPLRRGLHHLQHLLDHRRTAHPRAGAPAGGRRQSTTDLSIRAGRGGHRWSRGLSDRPRTGRSHCAGHRGAAQGLRHLAAGQRSRVPAPYGCRRHRRRGRRHRAFGHQPGSTGSSDPTGGRSRRLPRNAGRVLRATHRGRIRGHRPRRDRVARRAAQAGHPTGRHWGGGRFHRHRNAGPLGCPPPGQCHRSTTPDSRDGRPPGP